MLFVPGNSWNFVLSNVSATRPATAWGTSVTPAILAKSTWVQIFTGAQVSTEIFGVLVLINNGSTSATTRNMLVDIGIDPLGGTNYTTVIPDLLGGHAAPITVGGIYYYFPLYIPAGSSVAARALGTATAFNVALTLFGKPRRPDSVMVGQKVFAFGAAGGTSAVGTTVTAGTTAEGAWTNLGSFTSMPLWWWQCGLTCTDNTMSANAHTIDIATGDATNKDIVLQDVLSIFTAAEQITTLPAVYPGFDRTATGSLVYGRVQCSGTPDASLSMMAYGLG